MLLSSPLRLLGTDGGFCIGPRGLCCFVLQLLSGDPSVGAQAWRLREDIEHATTHAMTIDDQDDDTRLYLGPTRDAKLLEVVTIVRGDGSELAIHAMPMRAKYRRLLPGG